MQRTVVDLMVEMNWSATISMYSRGGVTADSRYSTAELYDSSSGLSLSSSILRISGLREFELKNLLVLLSRESRRELALTRRE